METAWEESINAATKEGDYESTCRPGLNKMSLTNFIESINAEFKFDNILADLQLNIAGEIKSSEHGRIAKNLITPTVECGNVLVRFYPCELDNVKLETGSVEFEVRALQILHEFNLPVPVPLLFINDSRQYINRIGTFNVFAYKMLPGRPLKRQELTPETALACGQLLSRLIEAASNFVPLNGDYRSKGDIEHLIVIAGKLSTKHPELKENPRFIEMLRFTEQPSIHESLSQTPMGIVHGDFFHENVLVDDDSNHHVIPTGIIDFGDAYYGHLIMDICIGAMELSFVQDAELDLHCLREFLRPNMKWLVDNQIDCNLFIDLLLVNCFRFAMYTYDDCFDTNPYCKRFKDLSAPHVKNQIHEIYSHLIQEHT